MHSGPFSGHGLQKPEQAEITRLKREVARLKAERDILKKAAAYFAKDRDWVHRCRWTTLLGDQWPHDGGEDGRWQMGGSQIQKPYLPAYAYR